MAEHARRAALALGFVAVLAGGMAACGDDDDDGGGGGELTSADVRLNLEDAGYTVEELGSEEVPATFSADFATGEEAGFETAFSVSGQGLDPPIPDFGNTVSVFVYETEDDAEEAFDSLGGDTPRRKNEENVIYAYAGGTIEPAPPEFEEAIEAAQQ